MPPRGKGSMYELFRQWKKLINFQVGKGGKSDRWIYFYRLLWLFHLISIFFVSLINVFDSLHIIHVISNVFLLCAMYNE